MFVPSLQISCSGEKNTFWNDQNFFVKVDPSHFSFKTCVDQQFAGKNLLQCETFFISLIFFAGETFKNWGRGGCNSILLFIQPVNHSICITSLVERERGRYPCDFQEYSVDILPSSKVEPFFSFLFHKYS